MAASRHARPVRSRYAFGTYLAPQVTHQAEGSERSDEGTQTRNAESGGPWLGYRANPVPRRADRDCGHRRRVRPGRARAPPDEHGHRRQPVPAADDLCSDTQADSAPPQRTSEDPQTARQTELRCGPVESRMRAAQITDQATLLRAAAIDRAGDQLFNNAAKLAAQDTPAKPAPMAARQMSLHSRSFQKAQARSRQP